MIIGLTGSIASGKSTVSSMFQKLGAYLIDWDVLAREVVKPHRKAWEEILDYFGTEVLSKDLSLDRPKLGDIIFNDAEKRERLNQIIHPQIYKEDENKVNEIREIDRDAIIVKDIPLLTETSQQGLVDRVVVVWSSEEHQMARLKDRGFSAEESKQRISSQDPLEEKVKFADFVICNDGTLEETRRQVEDIFRQIKEGAGA